MRPPTFNCSIHAGGISSPAAAATMASKGAAAEHTQCTIAKYQPHVGQAQRSQVFARLLVQRAQALDADNFTEQLCQHRRGVTAPGTDFEYARGARVGQLFERQLRRSRDDVWLRNRLPMTDRQRGVFIRAAGERFVDEQCRGTLRSASSTRASRTPSSRTRSTMRSRTRADTSPLGWSSAPP